MNRMLKRHPRLLMFPLLNSSLPSLMILLYYILFLSLSNIVKPDPEIQPARDDINLNFESSTKYNIVTSAVTSAKIVTTTLLLFSTQLNCWGSQERWIVLMLIFDIVYAVGIFLKIKTMRALDSLLQSVHSSRSVMDTSQRINSIQNTILNIQQRNHSLSDVREPLLINNERTCNVTALLERKKSALTSLLFFGDM